MSKYLLLGNRAGFTGITSVPQSGRTLQLRKEALAFIVCGLKKFPCAEYAECELILDGLCRKS
ncbi:hypothetical protein EW594_23240, partial [Salmonella enterica subsp. enterica serovar Liverpool]|nr:hypothetical protein [Salmonella enterica]EBH2677640.1 hypothetical protein [Salmonella enterica]EBH9911758.1 hypothetical protein [Salmonella enterica subsp. enterica serovar Liverpool]